MKKTKRFLAIILAVTLIICSVSCLGLTAFAEENWLWPIATSVPGSTTLSRGYWYNSSSDKHAGVDIAVGKGTQIMATKSGTVWRTYTGCGNERNQPCSSSTCGGSAWSGRSSDGYCGQTYGNSVFIKHNDGTISIYGHLSAVYVTTGTQVSQGSVIGLSGTTGHSTGYHLHFQITTKESSWSSNSINNNPKNSGFSIGNSKTDMAHATITYSTVNTVGGGSTQPQTVSTNPNDYPFPTRNIYHTSPETMKGDDVKWIQAVLYQLGYGITIDGSYGQGTTNVVKQFQQNNGLEVDGRCGPATRTALLNAWNNLIHKHSYGDWQVVTAATCTANGTSRRVCSCGDVQTRTDAALGHSWNSGEIVASASCSSEGLKKYTCLRCGTITTEAISAAGHTPVTDNGIAATCTEDGVTEGSHCAVCNAIIKAQQIAPALGHDYKIISVKKGCDFVIPTYKCTRCDKTYEGDKKESIEFDWSESKPEDIDDNLIESKTQYSYRDKSTTTSELSYLSGWTLDHSTWVWSDYGAWSGWSDSPYYASDSRQVDTQTVIASYNYKTVWHYYCYSSSSGLSGGTSYYPNSKYGYTKYSFDLDEALAPTGTTYTYNGYTMVQYKWWYSNTRYHHVYAVYPGEYPYQYTTQEVVSTNYKTQYRYRDRYQIFTYYHYKWSDFSDWSDTEFIANENREVNTRTLYKFSVIPMGHKYLTSYECDVEGHWHKCENCDQITVKEAHIYDNDSDTICNECGYERNVMPVPENLTCTAYTKSTLTLSWDKIGGAKGYKIYCSQLDKSYKIKGADNTTYKIQNLKECKNYDFQICYFENDGTGDQYGEYSQSFRYCTRPSAVTVTELNNSSSGSKHSFTVTHTTVKNVSGYEIKYQLVGAKNYKTYNRTNSDPKTIEVAKAGTYTVWIRAYKSAKYDGVNKFKANGDWSESYTIEVK